MSELVTHNGLVFVFLSILAAIIILSYKCYHFNQDIEKKNIKLIKYHLDVKFVQKHLIASLENSNSDVFCQNFIVQLKEYYNLEDIVVVDSLNMLFHENNTILRAGIIDYIQNNMNAIMDSLSDYGLTRFYCKIQSTSYELYISRIMPHGEGEGVIICVEEAPTLLVEQEKESLEICLNILKNRLIYS